MADLETGDIQGMIVTGYGHLANSAYLFLRVDDPARAKEWLARIVPSVTSAKWDTGPGGRVERPEWALNVAFTAQGLAALGVGEAALETFPDEFRAGMAEPGRARLLGDVGGSAPEHWEIGGPDQADDLHVLLIVQANGREVLAARVREQRALFGPGGVRESAPLQEGYLPADGREHFGFRDSISQPEMEGSPRRSPTAEDCVKAGEFVLGYPNEYGNLPPTPTVPAAADAHGNLPPLRSDVASPDVRDLGRNGSYLVFRKLEQDVAGFRRYFEESFSPEERGLMAAKFVGRWPNGAPLALAPEHEDPRYAEPPQNNDFGYATTDPHGFRCPVGAHIRRVNPRDALGADPAKSLESVNRHRILRRGALYGGQSGEGDTEGGRRGVLFFCVNADIERQFEFVQHTWINNPRFGGNYNDRDPLLGANGDPGLADDGPPPGMTIPGEPARRRVVGLPRFVAVRGGGYFFMPGISALRFLAGTPR